MDERRKATRVGLVSEVQIQPVVPEGSSSIAWGADLSEGGIGLLAHNPIRVGEEVSLQIAVPGSQIPISVKGRVAWQQSVTSGFRLGIQFQEVEALSQARILQLVTERLARLSIRPTAALPSEQAGAAQAAATPTVQPGQAQVQPESTPAIPSAPAEKPVRVRRPLVTILLAVVALALFLQNRELTRSVRELKAQVTALQTLGQ